jgi:hypothetical protein
VHLQHKRRSRCLALQFKHNAAMPCTHERRIFSCLSHSQLHTPPAQVAVDAGRQVSTLQLPPRRRRLVQRRPQRSHDARCAEAALGGVEGGHALCGLRGWEQMLSKLAAACSLRSRTGDQHPAKMAAGQGMLARNCFAPLCS